MLALFALYLPCAFALGFFIIHLMRKKKSMTQWCFISILGMLTLLLFTNVLYMTSHHNMRMMMTAITLKHFASPALPLLGILYLESIMGKKITRWQIVKWMTLPLLCFTTIVVFNSFIGMEKLTAFLDALLDQRELAANYSNGIFFYYQHVNITLYYLLIWIECTVLAVKGWNIMQMNDFSWGSLYGFLFRGERISPLNVQCISAIIIAFLLVSRTLLPRYIFVFDSWIPVTTSFVCALLLMPFCYMALYTNIKEVTLDFVLSPVEEGSDKKKRVDAEGKQFVNIKTMEEDLLHRFHELMETEKPYLKPDLKLEDVALMLRTNRLYMSRIVNGKLDMTFTDYINKLRIDCAMAFMRTKPNATQDEIAVHCGFVSAQSFSRKFKQTTAETPSQWIAKNVKNQQ